MNPIDERQEGGPSPSSAPPPLIVVSSYEEAGGSLPSAAALACAGTDATRATLLIDLGGGRPRPTLLCTPAARALEACLARSLPLASVAARGGFCQLSLAADEGGFSAAATAVEVAGGVPVVVHVAGADLVPLLESRAASAATAVLVYRGDGMDPPPVPPACLELLERGLTVAVLERRLGWVIERRALFGALRSGDLHELPRALTQLLAGPAAGRNEIADAAVAR